VTQRSNRNSVVIPDGSLILIPEGAFVRVRTLATERVNARHREIDGRAFFVSRREITRICEFFKLGSYNSLRSLFEERFLECECNLQGCARECEKTVSNSLTLCFQRAPELTQSFHSEPPVKTGSNCLRKQPNGCDFMVKLRKKPILVKF
jgi:hypothetical protein